MAFAGTHHRDRFHDAAIALGLIALMMVLAACDEPGGSAATDARVPVVLPPWNGPPSDDASVVDDAGYRDAWSASTDAAVVDAPLDAGLETTTFTVTTPVTTLAGFAEMEDEFCAPLENLGQVFVHAFEVRASNGLHHTQTRVMSRQAGKVVHAWIFGTSTGTSNTSWALPAGTAVVIQDRTTLCISYHFVNASSAPIDVLVELRLYATTNGVGVQPAGLVTMETTQIDLPPGQSTSVSVECQVARRLEILALVPHAHARGRRFVVTHVGGVHDGEIITTWDNAWEAAWRDLTPRVVLEAGEALRVQCDYDNSDNYAVRYGTNADAEMCALTGIHLAGAGTLAGTETGMGCIIAPVQ